MFTWIMNTNSPFGLSANKLKLLILVSGSDVKECCMSTCDEHQHLNVSNFISGHFCSFCLFSCRHKSSRLNGYSQAIHQEVHIHRCINLRNCWIIIPLRNENKKLEGIFHIWDLSALITSAQTVTDISVSSESAHLKQKEWSLQEITRRLFSVTLYMRVPVASVQCQEFFLFLDSSQ